jgi:hypothetical protein
MSRSACLAASFLALLCAGLFVGGAGARSNTGSTPNPVAFDCAGPSAADVANSDFFWYWPCASFLHVSVNPAGMALGDVQSTPYAIDCPHACTRPFAEGTKVTLTAHPSDGASFAGWSGAACVGQGNPCVATVSGDTQVTANFSGTATETAGPLEELRVFVGNTPGPPPAHVTGTGGFDSTFCSAPCGKNYAQGTTVTLTATYGSSLAICDSADPGVNEPNPYVFSITSARVVSTWPSAHSC